MVRIVRSRFSSSYFPPPYPQSSSFSSFSFLFSFCPWKFPFKLAGRGEMTLQLQSGNLITQMHVNAYLLKGQFISFNCTLFSGDFVGRRVTMSPAPVTWQGLSGRWQWMKWRERGASGVRAHLHALATKPSAAIYQQYVNTDRSLQFSDLDGSSLHSEETLH